MKKTVSVVLSMIMVFTMLFALSACSPNSSVVGSWVLEEDGMSMVLTFEEGGKGSADVLGVKADLTWSEKDGKLTAAMSFMGNTDELFKDAPYTVDGNKLSITADGETVVLTKK